ncbi:MAG: hypothetical protein KAT70_05535 [Thermoplasmata archaeon]|nr:hypothetical protein [Thermoplasmata archaeon]
MRFVKITSEELKGIRDVYEGIMSYASHGLFFREGCVIGESIGKIAKEHAEDYFKVAGEVLKARGWVEDVEFHYRTAVVHGSVESFSNNTPTCHRMRGIMKRIYEIKTDRMFGCKEAECLAIGAKQCTFVLEESKV